MLFDVLLYLHNSTSFILSFHHLTIQKWAFAFVICNPWEDLSSPREGITTLGSQSRNISRLMVLVSDNAEVLGRPSCHDEGASRIRRGRAAGRCVAFLEPFGIGQHTVHVNMLCGVTTWKRC